MCSGNTNLEKAHVQMYLMFLPIFMHFLSLTPCPLIEPIIFICTHPSHMYQQLFIHYFTFYLQQYKKLQNVKIQKHQKKTSKPQERSKIVILLLMSLGSHPCHSSLDKSHLLLPSIVKSQSHFFLSLLLPTSKLHFNAMSYYFPNSPNIEFILL